MKELEQEEDEPELNQGFGYYFTLIIGHDEKFSRDRMKKRLVEMEDGRGALIFYQDNNVQEPDCARLGFVKDLSISDGSMRRLQATKLKEAIKGFLL